MDIKLLLNFMTFTSWLQIGVDVLNLNILFHMIGTTPFGQILIFLPSFCYMVINEHPKSDLTINNNLFQELD
jgi:hypothetical protein